jgi:hypothetical protein
MASTEEIIPNSFKLLNERRLSMGAEKGNAFLLKIGAARRRERLREENSGNGRAFHLQPYGAGGPRPPFLVEVVQLGSQARLRPGYSIAG